MLIVMAIIGLIAGISFPSVSSGLDSIQLKSAADGVANFLTAAMTRVDRREQAIEVVINPAENTLTLFSSEPGYTRRHELENGIRISGDRPTEFLLLPGGTPPEIYDRPVQSPRESQDRSDRPRYGSSSNVNRRGFTLLEVLVATTIMAVAVVTLLGGISTSMRNASRLTGYDQAVMRARSKMDELIVNHRDPVRCRPEREVRRQQWMECAHHAFRIASGNTRGTAPARSGLSSKSGGPKAASAIPFRLKDTAAV